jgi:hypothetical protein
MIDESSQKLAAFFHSAYECMPFPTKQVSLKLRSARISCAAEIVDSTAYLNALQFISHKKTPQQDRYGGLLRMQRGISIALTSFLDQAYSSTGR